MQVVGDGLAAQDGNPEVEVDISRPDIQINEQIFALKLVTNKLEAAYNGHSVEWPHYEPSKSKLANIGICLKAFDAEEIGKLIVANLTFFSSESPNDSGYGGGSGDCYASDDEDCYREGSGEGSGAEEGEQGDKWDDEEEDEEEGSGGWEEEGGSKGPQWPPWTVTEVPAVRDDVVLVEERTPPQTPRVAAGSWRLHASSTLGLLPLLLLALARP